MHGSCHNGVFASGKIVAHDHVLLQTYPFLDVACELPSCIGLCLKPDVVFDAGSVAQWKVE